MAGKNKEKVTFALEVLEDGLADAEAIRRERDPDSLLDGDLALYSPLEWEEVRSTLEFAVKILKGEAVRGG